MDEDAEAVDEVTEEEGKEGKEAERGVKVDEGRNLHPTVWKRS
jgi:hypothetical protein